MDKCIESTQKDSAETFDEEINKNYESAPPLLNNESPITIKPNGESSYQNNTNEQSNNSQNINNSNNLRHNNRRKKRKIDNYDNASTLRKIFQIIFSILLYSIVIISIIYQIYFGISIALIDDILILFLGTIMLILTIKGKSTADCKIGCLNLLILFIGFGIRGGGAAMVKEGSMHYFIIFLIRCFTLFIILLFNCNQSEEIVIHC